MSVRIFTVSAGVLTLVLIAVLVITGLTLAWWVRRRARWMAEWSPEPRAGDGRSPAKQGRPVDPPANSTWMRGGGGPFF
jgi:hypothetical protein